MNESKRLEVASNNMMRGKRFPSDVTPIVIWATLCTILGVVIAYSVHLEAGIVLAGAGFIVAFALRPNIIIYVTVLVAIVSVPDSIPLAFSVGPISLRLYEPLVVISALYAAIRFPGNPKLTRHFIGLSSVIIVWVLLGILLGNPLVRVFADIRLLIYFVIGYFIASRIARTTVAANLYQLFPWILTLSAIVSVYASITGVGLAGMQSEAAGSTAESTRMISPSTYPAIALMAAVVAAAVARHVNLRRNLITVTSSAVLMLLSFSRNALLTLGTAVIFALLASRRIQSVARVFLYALSGLAISMGAFFVVNNLTDSHLATWLLDQFDNFSERVLGGITLGAINSDSSAQFRFEQEDAYLLPAFQASPFVGHGFGYAYKPLETGRFITEKSDELRYYAHNFYLWMLVKTGLVGFILFVGIMARPIWHIFVNRISSGIGPAAGSIGLMAASLVAPMPLGSPTSLLFGAFLGTAAAFAWSSEQKGQIVR